ncbi:halimadienyl-diphosphate synthase [Herbihabitans rhizosphaerae]|uniref:Halimadienyl-diphosphate synthase n=1 Tax=Herbihabitans rhizosphaerae TaxID=1872711 RepID=A0A4Q7KGH8_9PSEU|nr:prenyltransferase/squalene oxidase repeat-containing protein [Herbihabitans rhizosphaerae]RZS33950.1 halimadienyl-diphosphate synthase [Herbihabitans rhizosphaerae]
MRDAIERADTIVGELDNRPVAGSAYSTAWAARLVHDDGRPVFEQAREWLRTHQHADGSWGSAVPNAYDRLVCTLAAVLTLSEVPGEWAAGAVRAGVDYLREHAADWRDAPGQIIGFEIVAPYLVEQARAAGLLEIDSRTELALLREEKLALVPEGALTSQPTALLYSLEALDDLVSVPDVLKFAAPDGSMSSNPAATAAVWAATKDPAALTYLRDAARSAGDGGLPEIYPIDVFEPAWTIYLLDRAGLKPSGVQQHVERFLRLSGEDGAPLGSSADFPLPDSDCTALVAIVAHSFGYETTPLLEALLPFERDDHFAGLPHERFAPVSGNAHVLEALSQQPHRFAAQIGKTRDFLLDARRESAWWHDKWHFSDHYATAQAVFGLAGATEPGTLAGTWRWLLDGQHPDGSWGAAGGQAEDTAYAVLSLDALAPHHGPVPEDTYRRAHAYLREHLDAPDYAELWIGKSLYTPPTVVRAAVAAAWVISGQADDE